MFNPNKSEKNTKKSKKNHKSVITQNRLKTQTQIDFEVEDEFT